MESSSEPSHPLLVVVLFLPLQAEDAICLPLSSKWVWGLGTTMTTTMTAIRYGYGGSEHLGWLAGHLVAVACVLIANSFQAILVDNFQHPLSGQ